SDLTRPRKSVRCLRSLRRVSARDSRSLVNRWRRGRSNWRLPASRRRNAWSRRRCAKPLEPDGSASSSTVIVELPTPPYIEVTYATYRCALRCGGAGGFERAGLGRLEVYSRRDWIRSWERGRDDGLTAD